MSEMLLLFEIILTMSEFERLKLPHTYVQLKTATCDTTKDGKLVGLIGGMWKNISKRNHDHHHDNDRDSSCIKLIAKMMLDEEKKRLNCFNTMIPGLWSKMITRLYENGETKYLLYLLTQISQMFIRHSTTTSTTSTTVAAAKSNSRNARNVKERSGEGSEGVEWWLSLSVVFENVIFACVTSVGGTVMEESYVYDVMIKLIENVYTTGLEIDLLKVLTCLRSKYHDGKVTEQVRSMSSRICLCLLTTGKNDIDYDDDHNENVEVKEEDEEVVLDVKREAVMLTVQIGGSAYLLNSLKDHGALMQSKRESVMMEWLYTAVDENEKYSDLQRMDGLISSTIFLHFVKWCISKYRIKGKIL